MSNMTEVVLQSTKRSIEADASLLADRLERLAHDLAHDAARLRAWNVDDRELGAGIPVNTCGVMQQSSSVETLVGQLKGQYDTYRGFRSAVDSDNKAEG